MGSSAILTPRGTNDVPQGIMQIEGRISEAWDNLRSTLLHNDSHDIAEAAHLQPPFTVH